MDILLDQMEGNEANRLLGSFGKLTSSQNWLQKKRVTLIFLVFRLKQMVLKEPSHLFSTIFSL